MSPRRVHLRITGLVQGVSYRASTRDAALELGVRGWVRNLSNGDVEALAEADAQIIEHFITWCRRGPEEARVTGVQIDEAATTEALNGFEVRR